MTGLPDTPPTLSRAPRGIQSIEVGGQLLHALVNEGRALPLTELARCAGMAPAKAHPYLVSFQKVGLVEQDLDSGRYGLGPLALQMGWIGLQQVDPVRWATPVIERLAEQTLMTAALAVWGNQGATLVRLAHAPTPVHVAMRHGTVMGVSETATGRLFAALLPTEVLQRTLGPKTARQVQTSLSAELEAIRQSDMARVDDTVVNGVSALAAPVRDAQGELVLSLTLIGPGATLASREGGAIPGLLQQEAAALSARLGWRARA